MEKQCEITQSFRVFLIAFHENTLQIGNKDLNRRLMIPEGIFNLITQLESILLSSHKQLYSRTFYTNVNHLIKKKNSIRQKKTISRYIIQHCSSANSACHASRYMFTECIPSSSFCHALAVICQSKPPINLNRLYIHNKRNSFRCLSNC